MSNRIKSFERVVHTLAGAGVSLLLLMGGQAYSAEWPLELTWEQMPIIPNNEGMVYFQRKWINPGYTGGGDMVITKQAFEFTDAPPYARSPYKVLHTAPNYVLIATLDTFDDGGQWTRFRILNLMHGSKKSRVAAPGAELRVHYCTDPTMERPEPFRWPVQTLLERFAASECLRKLGANEAPWHSSIGWSNERWSSVKQN